MSFQSVTTLDAADSKFDLQSIAASGEPVLIKGLVAAWPATEAASGGLEGLKGYLNQFATDQPVTAYVGAAEINGKFGYTGAMDGFNFRSGQAPLPAIFDRLQEQQALPDAERMAIYVGSTAVDQWLPTFRDTNDIPLSKPDMLVSFWLGNATKVSAHYDLPQNIACVVAGTREFTFFPPEQVANLYVGPIDRTPSGQAISLADLDAPDFDRYPKLKEALASARRCICEPGDAVVIPSMWWHQVKASAGCNLLVNYWWLEGDVYRGSPQAAMLHAMLTIREMPANQRDAWRAMFEHYVFSGGEAARAHIPEHARGLLSPLADTEARRLRADIINRLNRE